MQAQTLFSQQLYFIQPNGFILIYPCSCSSQRRVLKNKIYLRQVNLFHLSTVHMSVADGTINRTFSNACSSTPVGYGLRRKQGIASF